MDALKLEKENDDVFSLQWYSSKIKENLPDFKKANV